MQGVLKELEEQKKRNLLVVISGPTCSGKDTVMKALLERNSNMTRLVTTNSRPKRPGEREGVDYYFVSQEEFERLIGEGAFFEWVEYRGSYRGTQKRHVKEALASGKDVIWRIDVRGVKNIAEKVRKEIKRVVFIFLVEELEVLKKRMERRATEDPRWRNWSVDRALWEMDQYQEFDYVVRNAEGKLEETVKMIEAIVTAEKLRVRRS